MSKREALPGTIFLGFDRAPEVLELVKGFLPVLGQLVEKGFRASMAGRYFYTTHYHPIEQDPVSQKLSFPMQIRPQTPMTLRLAGIYPEGSPLLTGDLEICDPRKYWLTLEGEVGYAALKAYPNLPTDAASDALGIMAAALRENLEEFGPYQVSAVPPTAEA